MATRTKIKWENVQRQLDDYIGFMKVNGKPVKQVVLTRDQYDAAVKHLSEPNYQGVALVSERDYWLESAR
jgi:hypothetical protein